MKDVFVGLVSGVVIVEFLFWLVGAPLWLPIVVIGLALVVVVPTLIFPSYRGGIEAAKGGAGFRAQRSWTSAVKALGGVLFAVVIAGVAFVLAMNTKNAALGIVFMCVGAGIVIALPILLIKRLLFRPERSSEVLNTEQSTQRDRFSEYERAGFRVERSWTKLVVAGNHAGVAFEHFIIPGEKSTPTRVAVSTPTVAPGEFDVLPESGGTELAKTLGMVDEFQTGDAALDSKYYFSGSTDEYVRAVFGDHKNLQHLRALLAGTCTEVQKDAKRLTALGPGKLTLPVAELRAIVEHLAALRLPAEVPGAVDRKLTDKTALNLVRATAWAFIAVGFVGWYLTKPLLDGVTTVALAMWPLVSALLGVMLIATYFTLKDRSMAVVALLEVLIYVPMLAFALPGALMLANERFDASAPERREARLLRANATQGRRNSVYRHVWFESWRQRTHEHFVVDDHTYELAQRTQGQIWELQLRQGWLGHSWLDSLQPAGLPK
jgi:hypothetical protein